MEGIGIENATHAPVDFDTNIATTITAHDAGYINQPLEKQCARGLLAKDLSSSIVIRTSAA